MWEFVGGLLAIGDFGLSHKQGIGAMGSGGAMGAVMGFVGGYKYAKDNNLNPWSGKYNNSVSMGGPQSRVDKFAPDLNSEIIKNSKTFDVWPESLGNGYLGHDTPNPDAIRFNQKWINSVLDSNTPIYNFGREGISPFYNGVEMNTIMSRGYQNIIPA